MSRLVKNLRGLGQLAELFEPSDPVRPGVENVMVEIAPGVFRSAHRERVSPGARLLRELNSAQQVADNVRERFAELQRRVNDSRRGQR